MKNLYDEIPADIPHEIFQTLAENSQIKIERIVSKGHASPATGWYDQEQHEWVMVVKGQAIIEFETLPEQRLMCGDYLLIPAHQKHRVSWTIPDEETIWLAVFFNG